MTKNIFACALISILLVAAISGCGSRLDDPDHPPTPEEIAHAEDMMRQLPSVHDTESQLSALMRQIAEAVTAAAPALSWETRINRGQNTIGCPGPYAKTNGVSMTTDLLRSPAPISDGQWPGVVTIARDIAAQHGLTSLTVLADDPGNHDVILHSPDQGNEIRIGTREATVMTGVTGCRFRAEDLQNPPAK
jgi:Lipoprotein confined to pathogenic Mycobacterium